MCNCPVFLINFSSGVLGNMISTEDAQGGIHVHGSGSHHDGLSCTRLRSLRKPVFEMLACDSLLDGDVDTREYEVNMLNKVDIGRTQGPCE